MRVIKFFLSFLFFVLFVSVTSFFVGREVLLFKATEDLRSSITKIKRASEVATYNSQCGMRGGRGNPVKQVQIRFTSDQEYVAEVLCEYYTEEPIIVSTVKLPPWVKKVPGQAGLIWDPDGRSGVSLSIFGLGRTFILDGEEIIVSRGIIPIEGNFPIASCESFGYHCCDSITEIGQSNQISQTSDCPAQCFEVCQPRPIVLRFLTDPATDLRNRTVSIPKGQTIIFHYVIDPAAYQLSEVVIDFGDGQKTTVTEPQGQVEHQYQSCQQRSCVYTANVQAITTERISSIITPISSIAVTVE